MLVRVVVRCRGSRARVDEEVAEDLAGGGVDDPDVQVLDKQQDVGAGAGSADADVAQSAGDAQGDGAVLADLVGADPVVGVAGPVGGGDGLGAGVVDRGRGRTAG
ncbi:hypothetical protein ACJ5H2_22580 (plasmid) [Nocardioides sp. R1-1]|uniref:hypothetical protein n=1 Tax=Nocardioides sp. R1-1 TaxID=3383502 RepID=UPI0038D05866